MNPTKKRNYHFIILPKDNLLRFNLKEVWDYKDLIILFTKRNFVLTYKQTILGPAWIFLNPFLTSLIYTFVFGGIAGISTDGVPQILFYLSGNAIWSYFSRCVTKNANTFTANANVFGKVYFPRLTVPISNVLSSAIEFGVNMILVGIVLIYYIVKGNVSPEWSALPLLLPVLLHLGIMGFSFGIIISSLTTKYRDLAILVNFGVQLWMYITPIVYPLSQVPESTFKMILKINPVTAPVEVFRHIILGTAMIEWQFILISWIITFIVAAWGILIFNKVEKTFMDTV